MAKKPLPADTGAINSPFAGLGQKTGPLPPGPPPASTPAPAPRPAPRVPARAVVRYERKGHGGKEKTRVEHLGLGPRELEAWLKDAKGALGCGGALDGDTLLLNGDQRERLGPWLEKRGVGKVTVS